MNKYTCGVPNINCNGVMVILNKGLRHSDLKVHSVPEEAFRCYARYLVNKLGYTRVGNREFQASPDSPITVLTKKSRFGGVFRQGKHEKGASSGKRVISKGFSGGLIASY